MELSGISTLGSSPPRLPPPLERGDKVGVAALSGAVDPGRLSRGLRQLRGMGYVPVEASNLRCRERIFAGGDQARLDGFHQLAANPEIRAIIFARGGHGVLRILPALDWDLLGRYPRAYVGYSDLTPFLLQVVSRLGLVAFHGPMVAADFARGLLGEERHALDACLRGRLPLRYDLAGCSVEREVAGPLLGGCLSLLEATLGTPHAIDFGGALLFLEDIDEPYYRLDRMLTHLRLSDSLTAIKGMIFGHIVTKRRGSERRAGRRSSRGRGIQRRSRGRQLKVREEELAKHLSQEHQLPYSWGLNVGHDSPNLTLPLGLGARIHPTSKGCGLIVGEGLPFESTPGSVAT